MDSWQSWRKMILENLMKNNGFEPVDPNSKREVNDLGGKVRQFFDDNKFSSTQRIYGWSRLPKWVAWAVLHDNDDNNDHISVCAVFRYTVRAKNTSGWELFSSCWWGKGGFDEDSAASILNEKDSR